MPAKMLAAASTGERGLPVEILAEGRGLRAGDWIAAQRPQAEMPVVAGEMPRGEPTGVFMPQAADSIAVLTPLGAGLIEARAIQAGASTGVRELQTEAVLPRRIGRAFSVSL